MPQTCEFLDRLAELPPGVELAAALAGLDLAEVPNGRIVDVLQAQHRQLAHDQARLLAGIVEVSRTTPAPEPSGDRDQDAARRAAWAEMVSRAETGQEWAGGEVAAALTWTATAADRELHFAATVHTHLPLVFDALWAGRIDRAKAWIFAHHLDPDLGELTPTQIHTLCERFVPEAPRLTTRQLAHRLQRAIQEIDPEFARRRYRRSIRDRSVHWYLDRSGTVTLTGHGLAPHEAVAACERIDRLADAARRAGHPGRLAQIAADLYVGMLDGRFAGMSENEIIADLLAHPRPEDADDPDPESAAAPSPADRGGSDDHPARTPRGRPPQPHPDPSPSAPDDPTAGKASTSGDAGRADEPAVSAATGSPRPLRQGIEIRIGLATLIGLDDRSGEIPGLGAITADAARTAVTAQHQGAEWRYAITDPDGYLILAGTTRRRPRYPRTATPPGGPRGRTRGGVVEIHVPAAVLAILAADAARCGPWAGIAADLAAQYARRDQLLAGLDANPRARFARGPLARHVQVRDRTCTHPGCTRPACESDLDHTHDHGKGGKTIRANLGPGCKRHHPAKHGLGWRLIQPEPGCFEWTSPLGRTYHTRGEAITPPMPDPAPEATDPYEPTGRPIDLPILWSRPPPEPRPPPPPDEDDEPPPF